MNIHIPFKRQALAGALALTLVAACLPAPQQPTAAPNLNFAPTLPAATEVASSAATPTAGLPTPGVVATPTIVYTKAASDMSKLPDPLAGWQQGDHSVPISITEYGDFQ
jgi:FtsP/CotA-like multicopper oxidase with cupredoxin domain